MKAEHVEEMHELLTTIFEKAVEEFEQYELEELKAMDDEGAKIFIDWLTRTDKVLKDIKDHA